MELKMKDSIVWIALCVCFCALVAQDCYEESSSINSCRYACGVGRMLRYSKKDGCVCIDGDKKPLN